MACPWGKIQTPEPVNLKDIIYEEIACNMQAKEDEKFISLCGLADESGGFDEACCVPLETNEADLESDREIARMLQAQYDKEHDASLKNSEKRINGSSKVMVSFQNHMRAPRSYDFESDDEEEEPVDLLDRKSWDSFDDVNKVYHSIPPCGYKHTQGGIITKHDINLNGRRNVCKMMSFPVSFETGDGAQFDFKLSNKVFNSLRRHSKHEESKRIRIRDKKSDQATAVFGLDQFTTLLLFKMVNNQFLKSVNGVISIGKEAVVIHADSDPEYPESTLPKELVLKIFKTTLSEFKQRDQYIKDDFRFKDRIGKQTSRNTVHLWAEKEMRNLNRLKRAGISSPEPIALKKHVLVMSFIGNNGIPAPKLKEAALTEAEYILAYDQMIAIMKTLYTKANLIHADLSEYNILWHDDTCYLIDVSQSVEPSHDNAFDFLIRDCKNITNFFNRKSVPNVMTPEELFKEIVGKHYTERVALKTLQNQFKAKPHLMEQYETDLNASFEKAWTSRDNSSDISE